MTSKLIICPTCNNPTSVNASACPSCGEPLGNQQFRKVEIIEKLEQKKKRNKKVFIGLMSVSVLLFVILPIIGASVSPDMEELKRTDPDEYNRLQNEQALKEQEEARKRAQAESAKAERLAQEKAEEAKRKIAGFHCLSAWDGSHTSVEREVENRMREPDSFEHIETRITPVNEKGTHTLIMTYRARNGFGGMSIGKAIAVVQNDDCSATILSVE